MADIRLSLSAIPQFGGGGNLLESAVFSPSPDIAPSLYYVPGTGNPAVSTADYYLVNGMYPLAPFDLRTAGTAGAAIEAREGFRYLWMLAPDHPPLGFAFQGGLNFRVAYSNDPQILPSPTTMRQLVPFDVQESIGGQTGFYYYHVHKFVYNPDSSGDKFFVYCETASSGHGNQLGLFTTNDFLTYTSVGPVIPTTVFAGWSSFGNPVRQGVNDWFTVAYMSRSVSYQGSALYTSTDGISWTFDHQLTPTTGNPLYNNVIGGSAMNSALGRYVTYQSQDYVTCIEQLNSGASGSLTYASLVAIDASKNFLSSPAPIRLTDAYSQIYPGPTQVQSIGVYLEDGVMHFFVNRGFFTSGASYGLADGTYAQGGGLWQQFTDRYRFIYDATLAVDAAPVGVKARCTSGVVTLSWDDALPNRTYRVYKGSSSATQATLVGDVTGTSTTTSPTTGQQWWFKVVTLHSGVEKSSRVVHCYVSNNTAMVNAHVNRVIDDGGDATKIDMTFLASVDSYLSSNDFYKYLMHWVDVRFGIKVNGSGFVSKIYCLGTTRLPRGGDYTPTTSDTFPSTSSNTSYSTTSFRGTTPSWINNAATAHGYFGSGTTNSIQRKNEITLIAAYQRPSGVGIASLFGYAQSVTSTGLFLQQAAGASGNISFKMYQSNSLAGTAITATVAFASATTAKVVSAVFDGSNMTVYLDATPGTPVNASAYANPTLLNDAVLRGQYEVADNVTAVLCSASETGQQTLTTGAYTMDDQGLFTGAALIVFEKGLGSTPIAAITAMYA